ncbi:MAG: VWA domain-containing protein [Pirellulaceae bacterium]
MFSFAYPWIFLLLPLAWLVRRILPPIQRRSVAIRVPFGDRVHAAAGGSDPASKHAIGLWNLLPSLLSWLLVLTALARPQWIEPPVTKSLPTRDLLLLVDLSGSMRQQDFTNATGTQVDRLTAVKEVLGDFLTHRQGDRVGLVVFGDAPYLQSPFSTDLDLSRQLLEECDVGMAGPRTALGDAIGLGVNLLDESDAPAKTIIALTDGNDTKSQVPPVEAARVAAKHAIRIHTVAIGDPATVGEEKLDEQTLREVASATGGSYFFAADRQNLSEIYSELDQIETREVKTVSHRPRRDLYFWPLVFALLISLAEKGWVVFKRRNRLVAQSRTPTVHVDAVTGELEVA